MNLLVVKKFIEPRIERIVPKINPIKVSIMGVVSMLFAGVFLLLGYIIPAAIFTAVSGILDVVDGAIARKYGIVSPLGSATDRICDRISDGIIMVVMGVLYSPLVGMMTILLTLLSSYAGAIMEGLVRGRFVEKTTLRPLRIFVIVVGILLGKGLETLFVLSAIALYSLLYRLMRIATYKEKSGAA